MTGTIVDLNDPCLSIEAAITGRVDFRRIVLELSSLIKLEEEKFDQDIKNLCVDSPEFLQDVYEDLEERQTELVENLIGLCCVLAQTHVTRVKKAARGVFPKDDIKSIKFLGSEFSWGDSSNSFVYFVWHLANYYKHGEGWDFDTWIDTRKAAGKSDEPRRTREIVEKLGIKLRQQDNMQIAFRSLGVSYVEDFRRLADEIDRWSQRVLQCAKAATGK